MTITGPNQFRQADNKRPDIKEVQDFHTNSDVDGSPKSLHHTLGPGPNQAAAGNHTHDGGGSTGLSDYSLNTHNHDTAYDARYYKTDVPWSAMSLQNSWVNYGSGFCPAQYRRIGDIVQLRGVIKTGTAVPSTIDVFSPRVAGTSEIFIQPANAGAGLSGNCRIDILSTGSLVLVGFATGSNSSFVSLSGIWWSEI
jgi:hypothetical protein